MGDRKIKISITDHSVWGEGLFIWAVYRVDVVYGDDSWSIYRRFSHFTSLQTELTKVYGEPYMASYLAVLHNQNGSNAAAGVLANIGESLWQNAVMSVPTDQSTCARKPLLANYITQLLSNEHICQQPIFLSFLDVTRKGVPGAIKILGKENVLLQIMTNTNRPTFYISAYPLWGIKFIIIAKTGTLYLFTTMYDPFDKAEMALDLRKSTHISSEELIVHVKQDDKRLSFVLPSRDEVATWMRIMSNMSMKSSAAVVPLSTAEAAANAKKAKEITPSAAPTKEPEVGPEVEENTYGF